ncbi:hypothetical protein GCM10017559_84810 [Streptosporangium longisporum]|uniref:Uncharacterized protein n=1 Tax=Streptosporangium longisporum TaxID=46187 RepID=A0ABP6LJM7_9ACTN
MQAAASPVEVVRAAGLAFDKALTEALRAAEANQRATFGVRSYDDRIRRRRARATPRGPGGPTRSTGCAPCASGTG